MRATVFAVFLMRLIKHCLILLLMRRRTPLGRDRRSAVAAKRAFLMACVCVWCASGAIFDTLRELATPQASSRRNGNSRDRTREEIQFFLLFLFVWRERAHHYNVPYVRALKRIRRSHSDFAGCRCRSRICAGAGTYQPLITPHVARNNVGLDSPARPSQHRRGPIRFAHSGDWRRARCADLNRTRAHIYLKRGRSLRRCAHAIYSCSRF